MSGTRHEPGTGKRFGPYLLEKRLGQGGMAGVWLACKEDASGLFPRFALKIIHDHLSGQERFQELFRREARIHIGLNHPNLVKAFEVVQSGERLALVMERMDGSLETVTAKWKPDQVAEIVRQSAFALDYLHHPPEKETRSPIVHRDLSPSNLLLDGFGTVKIGDFGIARLSYSSGLTVHTPGKPMYMAPEQFEGQETAASDIYSLGVVALEAWKGENSPQIQEVGTSRHDLFTECLNELTSEHEKLVELLRSMLDPDPTCRPTAAEIVTELSGKDWHPGAFVLKGLVGTRNEPRVTPSAAPTRVMQGGALDFAPEKETPSGTTTRFRPFLFLLIAAIVGLFAFLVLNVALYDAPEETPGFGPVAETPVPFVEDALVVISAKTKHEVFLDGQPAGVTPLKLRIPAGRHVVGVRKGDGPLEERPIVAVRGANAEVYFKH